MIIDSHIHAFPRVICNERERFFTGEPAFRLLYASPKSQLMGADDIITMMDQEGVDQSVIFGFPWQNIETCRLGNDYILEAVSRRPDRLRGFCCVDPMHLEAAAEVERCLQAGMSGVGELAFYTFGIDARCLDRLEPIMARARMFDCPVMLHTNEPVGHRYPGKSPNTLAQIYALIQRFPENRLILAHWGGGIFFYTLLKKEVRETLANVWFDTAASPYLYRPQIYAQALDQAGADRILFGSDYPLLKPGRYFKDMERAGLSESQMAAVCGGNAARVLGPLPSPPSPSGK